LCYSIALALAGTGMTASQEDFEAARGALPKTLKPMSKEIAPH
jgi:hypothetical protein